MQKANLHPSRKRKVARTRSGRLTTHDSRHHHLAFRYIQAPSKAAGSQIGAQTSTKMNSWVNNLPAALRPLTAVAHVSFSHVSWPASFGSCPMVGFCSSVTLIVENAAVSF